MKVCVIQPPYSTDYQNISSYFEKELELLDKCDDTMDIIVMPESCDIPCFARTKEESEAAVCKFNDAILKKASETAKRCNSILFINARSKSDKGYRNDIWKKAYPYLYNILEDEPCLPKYNKFYNNEIVGGLGVAYSKPELNDMVFYENNTYIPFEKKQEKNSNFTTWYFVEENK